MIFSVRVKNEMTSFKNENQEEITESMQGFCNEGASYKGARLLSEKSIYKKCHEKVVGEMKTEYIMKRYDISEEEASKKMSEMKQIVQKLVEQSGCEMKELTQ